MDPHTEYRDLEVFASSYCYDILAVRYSLRRNTGNSGIRCKNRTWLGNTINYHLKLEIYTFNYKHGNKFNHVMINGSRTSLWEAFFKLD
jgi:hypothetical protein